MTRLQPVSGRSATWGTGPVGADTTRLRFRGDGRAYEQFGRVPHREAARGERWAMVEGLRVGCYRDGMTYVEARLAALIDGPDEHRLARPDELPEGVQRAREVLASIEVDPGEAAPAVGRFDLAGELRFEDGREGQALLRAAAHVDLPWLKAGTEGSRRGGLESVMWRSVNGRSIAYRLYDKGREAGTDEPGTRLRLERQLRYRKAREMAPAALLTLDTAALYQGRHWPQLVEALEAVRVDRAGAIAHVRRMLDAGRISSELAEKLAGFVHLEGAGMPRRSVYRRWSQLRSLGIALDLHDGDGEVVPIGRYVGAIGEAWAVAA